MPCSGFYICRVCSEMKIFLKDWYNVDIPEKNRLHPFEQDGLWKILNIDNISLVDTWMFEEREGQYLRHVASHDSYNRIPYLINQSIEIDGYWCNELLLKHHFLNSKIIPTTVDYNVYF